ncbi:hypothetical protein PR048_030014 [Dryococelus australis]|uniref:Uncharacterized protein n=1 Tax=Dryococelus australis TaxID=614101 RepID=A0ABQ9GBP1_9NEOP|nr:hypothetical protein PR048_030014 [Dryococelus australis]
MYLRCALAVKQVKLSIGHKRLPEGDASVRDARYATPEQSVMTNEGDAQRGRTGVEAFQRETRTVAVLKSSLASLCRRREWPSGEWVGSPEKGRQTIRGGSRIN